MGFGFSSMPSAQQRAAQAMAQMPNTMAMAQAAQQAAMGGGAPQPPPAEPSAAGAPGGMNLQAPQQFPSPKPYIPGQIQMPDPARGIPTQTPWTPGGVNLPPQYAGAGSAPAAGVGESEAGASFLSDLAALFGG